MAAGVSWQDGTGRTFEEKLQAENTGQRIEGKQGSGRRLAGGVWRGNDEENSRRIRRWP